MKQTAAIETGICVTDLERMLSFYNAVLSCEEVRRSPIPVELSEQLTLAPDGYLCVWLQTPYGERIKLMSAPQAPQVVDPARYLTDRSGIAYLTFYCSDLSEVLAAAEAAGATLMSDRALVAPEAPLRLCFFRDPEGNVIELVQSASDGG
jgi:catechol 2,3-dioxygenase-like lactoylglutathione lyase family enzyme